jgi:hypothetical protein
MWVSLKFQVLFWNFKAIGVYSHSYLNLQSI